MQEMRVFSCTASSRVDPCNRRLGRGLDWQCQLWLFGTSNRFIRELYLQASRTLYWLRSAFGFRHRGSLSQDGWPVPEASSCAVEPVPMICGVPHSVGKGGSIRSDEYALILRLHPCPLYVHPELGLALNYALSGQHLTGPGSKILHVCERLYNQHIAKEVVQRVEIIAVLEQLIAVVPVGLGYKVSPTKFVIVTQPQSSWLVFIVLALRSRLE